MNVLSAEIKYRVAIEALRAAVSRPIRYAIIGPYEDERAEIYLAVTNVLHNYLKR